MSNKTSVKPKSGRPKKNATPTWSIEEVSEATVFEKPEEIEEIEEEDFADDGDQIDDEEREGEIIDLDKQQVVPPPQYVSAPLPPPAPPAAPAPFVSPDPRVDYQYAQQEAKIAQMQADIGKMQADNQQLVGILQQFLAEEANRKSAVSIPADTAMSQGGNENEGGEQIVPTNGNNLVLQMLAHATQFFQALAPVAGLLIQNRIPPTPTMANAMESLGPALQAVEMVGKMQDRINEAMSLTLKKNLIDEGKIADAVAQMVLKRLNVPTE